MNIFMIAGGVLVVLLGLLLIYVGTRPNTMHYERSLLIEAPADAIFPLINDFHLWGQWSPWEKLDPDMKRTYDGAASGPGAIYSWAGDKNIGEGRMTMLQTKPNEHLPIKLEFFKPFAATNEANFYLKPEAGGTRVTWTMDGPANFMSKVMGLFMNMEKMIGGAFEQGLADLSKAAKARATNA